MFVERLPSSNPKGRFTLLRETCGKLADPVARRNAVRILLVVQLEVSLRAIRKLMPYQQPAVPTLGNGVVPKVISNRPGVRARCGR